jgi:hypothetical protein
MPFDGSEHEHDARWRILKEIGDQLGEVEALLAREERWCKGVLETSDGRRCILGAMQAVPASRILEPVILSAIKEVTGRYYLRIDAFNDHRTTTHDLVLAVLGRAHDNVRAGIPFGRPLQWKSALRRSAKSAAAWLAGMAPVKPSSATPEGYSDSRAAG